MRFVWFYQRNLSQLSSSPLRQHFVGQMLSMMTARPIARGECSINCSSAQCSCAVTHVLYDPGQNTAVISFHYNVSTDTHELMIYALLQPINYEDKREGLEQTELR